MDEKRILSKIDQLNNYLDELERIKPNNVHDYVNSVINKRACERLL